MKAPIVAGKESETRLDQSKSFSSERGRANTRQVIVKSIRNNSVPNLTHDVKVPSDVVSGGEYRIQNLARLEQVS